MANICVECNSKIGIGNKAECLIPNDADFILCSECYKILRASGVDKLEQLGTPKQCDEFLNHIQTLNCRNKTKSCISDYVKNKKDAVEISNKGLCEEGSKVADKLQMLGGIILGFGILGSIVLGAMGENTTSTYYNGGFQWSVALTGIFYSVILSALLFGFAELLEIQFKNHELLKEISEKQKGGNDVS